jgi:hypothetical protein
VDDVGSRCFASGSPAANCSSGCWWHRRRGDRLSAGPIGRSYRTMPIDVRRIGADQCRYGNDLAVGGCDRLKDLCGRPRQDACASEILQSSDCNAAARAAARGSIANVFSWWSRKMKKGRKAALGGSGGLTGIAQAPAAMLEEPRTRAQARLAQPAFRKFAKRGRRVNDKSRVRQFGSVKRPSRWVCSLISGIDGCAARASRTFSRKAGRFDQIARLRTRRRSGASRWAGRVKRKTAPRGSFAAAQIWAPCASTIERQIASPIPMPLGLVV